MSATARDPLDDILRRLASCIRMLLATDGQRTAAILGVQRMLEGIGKNNNVDFHALADRIENGGVSEKYREEVRAQIIKAHEVGYEKGVRAAEARFRPDGKLEFSEVALFVERRINHLPPDKHEFIHKMAFYARQDIEPSPKQGKFLFDLFVQYLGGRIT
ncbi:MAG TPA: hypothetical protein VKG24_32025 [Pseudolabrys sp.]|nr:hypothetical protein [Pseudolabrys sp.]